MMVMIDWSDEAKKNVGSLCSLYYNLELRFFPSYVD
jgi:hypothetical protein